jgi:hypothetical protein
LSRKLDVASALLFIFGVWLLLEGLMALLSTEYYLDMWIGMMNEEWRPPPVSEIDDPKLLNFMTFTTHSYGFNALFGGLLFCVMSLIPYRKGEKWAWYAMLVIGGIMSFGMLLGTYVGMTSHLPVTLILVILWIAGLALPAKEVLGKPS